MYWPVLLVGLVLLLRPWLGAAIPSPTFLPFDAPTITLPWGIWAATHYDDGGKFYTFKNVRYGKAPVGALRFAAPEYPASLANPLEMQDSTFGPACHQIQAVTCDCPPANCPAKGNSTHGFLHAQTVGATSEDCLFLDLYVPESALMQPNVTLPVIVWFHGGGFLLGAKDSHDAGIPLYNGTGILNAARQAGQEAIFIASNYRLGAFGWMAGESMERDGLPNAGLHDQRLVLQWVQDFVHLVGGNASRVSAWGESAGGGSILHHLIAEDGQRDPLFSKAVVQSPGFQWQWDSSAGGVIEAVYQNFSRMSGCDHASLDCLRAQDEAVLAEQNQALYDSVKCEGRYSFGPVVDGSLIRRLPVVSFRQGKFWKALDSIIVSHVADETGGFVPKFVKNETDFRQFLQYLMPQSDLDLVRELVANKYVAGDARNRTAAVLRDAFFTCNTRQLVDAYERSRGHWLMQYDFLSWLGLAVHGADLLALFWNEDFDIGAVISNQYPSTPKVVVELVTATFGKYAQQYQSYFASYAIADNPNTARADKLPAWSETNSTDDGLLDNVMEAGYSLFGNYFNNATVDSLVARSSCDFWGVMADIIDQKYSREGETIDIDTPLRVQVGR